MNGIPDDTVRDKSHQITAMRRVVQTNNALIAQTGTQAHPSYARGLRTRDITWDLGRKGTVQPSPFDPSQTARRV